MRKAETGCWSIAKATQCINAYAQDESCYLAYTAHAKERLDERSFFVSDLRHVLGFGSVGDAPQVTARKGYCKYKICGRAPNSGGRTICLVVIPDLKRAAMKIVTIMWEDF